MGNQCWDAAPSMAGEQFHPRSFREKPKTEEIRLCLGSPSPGPSPSLIRSAELSSYNVKKKILILWRSSWSSVPLLGSHQGSLGMRGCPMGLSQNAAWCWWLARSEASLRSSQSSPNPSPHPPTLPCFICCFLSTNFPGQNLLSWPRFSWIQSPFSSTFLPGSEMGKSGWARGTTPKNPPKPSPGVGPWRSHPEAPPSRRAKGGGSRLETWTDGQQGVRKGTCQIPHAGKAPWILLPGQGHPLFPALRGVSALGAKLEPPQLAGFGAECSSFPHLPPCIPVNVLASLG